MFVQQVLDPHFSMWLMTSRCRSPRSVFSWLSCDLMSCRSNCICRMAMNSCRSVGVVPSSASTETIFICLCLKNFDFNSIASAFISFSFLSDHQIKIHTRARTRDGELNCRNNFVYFLLLVASSSITQNVWENLVMVRKNTIKSLRLLLRFHSYIQLPISKQLWLQSKIYHSTQFLRFTCSVHGLTMTSNVTTKSFLFLPFDIKIFPQSHYDAISKSFLNLARPFIIRKFLFSLLREHKTLIRRIIQKPTDDETMSHRRYIITVSFNYYPMISLPSI